MGSESQRPEEVPLDDRDGEERAAEQTDEDAWSGGEAVAEGRVTLLGVERLVGEGEAQVDVGSLARWANALVEEVAPEAASLSVQLVDDEGMSELSEAFRAERETTDVLSFPGEQTPEGLHLGDIVISVPYATRQASERAHGLAVELRVLLLHGLLHCMGYDHETDDGQMEQLEAQLRHRWLNAPPGDLSPSEAPFPDDVPGAAPRAPKSGFVVLIGRPNAGKSTLMNHYLGEKLAIVSDKPQTTRQRLLGILNDVRGQMVFLDTPGVHKPEHRLNRRMVKAATDAMQEADVLCLVVDAAVKWGKGDEFMIGLLSQVERPKLVALNKIDRIRKSRLLGLIEKLSKAPGVRHIVPISALTGEGADTLLDLLWEELPEGAPLYDPELLTTQSERFLVAERIREKVLEFTRDELPFATAVSVDSWREDEEMDRLLIQATILVERPGQKKIVIGHQGSMIKQIGTAARHDLQEFLGRRIFLDLFVRQVANWREDPRRLAEIDRQNAFDLP